MDSLDKKIKEALKKEIKEPYSYELAIKKALDKKKKYSLRQLVHKIIITIVSILGVLCGSIGVYAVTGGKIEGVPIMEWIGIKFSNQYIEYKEEVKEQTNTYNKTTVELVSYLASDYITMLEFDVKLSDEDKNYLRLGESLYTEQVSNTNGYHTSLVEESKKYINTIQLGFNKERVVGKELDSLLDMPSTKDSVYIDGEEIICRNYETVEKVSDNEYKIYHIFLLTDNDLKGKNNFNITLKNNIIANKGELKEGEEKPSIALLNTPDNQRRIEIEGEFSVDVSKDKILEDSKIIKLVNKKSIYKNVSQEIEEININPLQTIIRAKTIITGIDSNKKYFYNDELQNPLAIDFEVTDNEGRVLTSQSFETKKTLIYSNGKREEWAPGDIKDLVQYRNATFELKQYIVVEKSNTDKITIYPSFKVQEKGTYDEKCQELDKIEITINELKKD